MTRRRFLQLALASGVVAATPPVLLAGAREVEAAPLGASDGVLIVVLMAGGNDGLNTLIPFNDGAYHDAYGPLAFGGDRVLPISGSLGLHPNLLGVKARYDAGKVALIEGVGYPNPNLSHFESMATWMSGWAGGIASTGWLGRYLSGLGNTDPFTGIVFDDAVPLSLRGPSTSALTLPPNIGGAVGCPRVRARTTMTCSTCSPGSTTPATSVAGGPTHGTRPWATWSSSSADPAGLCRPAARGPPGPQVRRSGPDGEPQPRLPGHRNQLRRLRYPRQSGGLPRRSSA